MKFIETIKDGDQFREIYLIKTVTKGVVAKTGLPYLTIVFEDKTGTITGKLWNANNDALEAFKPGKFVEVLADASLYKDKLELRISDFYERNVVKYDDYIAVAPVPVEELTSKLEAYLAEIVDPDIKLIVDELYKEHKDKFITYPAATSNHHAFKSGLIYHTVSMLDMAKAVCSHYNDIDKDIVYAGCFIHDIGKIKELSGFMSSEYTVEGNLLGHLVIASNLIYFVAKTHNIDQSEKVLMLSHAVLASHGKLEFGSPVMGETKEAIVLNFLDDLDAKMMMFDNNVKNVNPGDFTSRITLFDNRKLYKKK